MKIIVFGKHGQVAQSIKALYGYENFEFLFLGRKSLNFENPEDCKEVILSLKPDGVIIAAAWTDVDKAEKFPKLVKLVNSVAPEYIAKGCDFLNIPFVHLSTDYVFDGTGRSPWRPHENINPISVYGESKAEGEFRVLENCKRSVIMRTSWVFSEFGNNFFKAIMKKGEQSKNISVVSDQVGGPTSAHSLANAVCTLLSQGINNAKKRVYHYSGTPDVSWAEFAKQIFEINNVNCEVKPIKSEDYCFLAKRPLNSRLDCSDIKKDFGIERPSWNSDLITITKKFRKTFK